MSKTSHAAAALFLVSTTAAHAQGASDCNLGDLKSMHELQRVLSQRAVEVIDRAARKESEARIGEYLTPSATFSLGAGDLQHSLATGVAGARALAGAMSADSYRFYGWDYIPEPAKDPCGTQKTDVEFSDSAARRSYRVEFTFRRGMIADGSGWTRTYTSGFLKKSRPAVP